MTSDRTRPDLDDATVEALGKLSEALETVDQARGHLYGLHQLTGRADLLLQDAVEKDVTRTGFRGCPFTNVSSEYDDPQHPARSAAADYKFELHTRLERLADELLPGAGDDLAAQVHLIIDGMYLSGGLLGPDGPASHGRALAEKLVDAALAGR